MLVFISLILKITPLYFNMLLGYIAGRFYQVDSATISKLLFNLLGPIIVFHTIATATITTSIITLPILVCFMCSIISTIVYFFSSYLFRDNTRNMIAFSSGSSSMGFFGLPIALALFDKNTLSIYIICYIGMAAFENSFGFYMIAKGLYTAKECLSRLAKLPPSWAVIAGIVFKILNIPVLDTFTDNINNIRGCYTVLGMLLLGLSVANIEKLILDWKYILTILVTKYILWPLAALLFIYLDRTFLNFYQEIQIYKALLLLAIIPVSGSGVIFATMLNYKSDRVAIVTLINTIFGAIYVPLVISLLIGTFT